MSAEKRRGEKSRTGEKIGERIQSYPTWMYKKKKRKKERKRK
jgi:hypothetical protein